MIVTMGSISEPPEVLGALIGGALVGTFLGVLLSYGVVGPISSSLNHYCEAEFQYYECLKAGILAHVSGYAPAVSIEFARKMLTAHERPTFAELEEELRSQLTIGYISNQTTQGWREIEVDYLPREVPVSHKTRYWKE